jgi:hypothetical protein
LSRSRLQPVTLVLAAALAFAEIWIGPAFALQSSPRTPAELEKEMQDKQLKEANKKRQQDIRNDTDRLFELATELKAAVDKSNEHLLSLDVVRKADEVEKLAKRVKEKMKESIGPGLNADPRPLPDPRLRQ